MADQQIAMALARRRVQHRPMPALPVPPPAAPGTRVAVVGAGIVGACAALQLQRAGWPTTLWDRGAPGHGASFGNAALISVHSCVPIALPGLLRQLPGWLLDRDGPLALRPADLPRALPWLWRRVRAGTRERAIACSRAMHALHHDAIAGYRGLLGEALFARLVATRGQVHVWESDTAGKTERFEAELRAAHGIAPQPLTAADIAALVPGLTPAIRRGLLFPAHAHTLDPQALVQALVGRFVEAGGTTVTCPVQAIGRDAQGAPTLHTPRGPQVFERLVLAGGIDAPALLEPLGVALPLQAERGYHLQTRSASAPALPVVHRERGFVLTPLADGVRAAGLVEIARHDRPPDPRRIARLRAQARRLMPSIAFDEHSSAWVGARPSTPDSLPIVGPVAGQPGLFVAAGHGHFGLTGAPMTARLLADLIGGRVPAIDPAPYALERFG